MKKKVFQVGDHVRITRATNNTLGGSGYSLTSGYIRQDNGNLRTYNVWGSPTGGNNYIGWFNAEELELMDTKFKAGDVVSYKNKGEYGSASKIVQRVVEKIPYNNSEIHYTVGGWDRAEDLQVDKPAGEVIGYELLKDLPGIPKGTVSSSEEYDQDENDICYRFEGGGSFNSFDTKQLADTSWFKPLYAPKNITIEISGGRQVTVNATHVDVNGLDTLTHKQFQDVKEYIEQKRQFSFQNRYDFQILTFKIGCQEFTKEDIALVHTTIQTIKK